jgi:hypothetical protein
MINQLKAEREKLLKALEAHKPDPALAARITELKTELAKLTAKAAGADIKVQIASYDRAIYALEHPTASGTCKPMSEAGKAAIKEGLRKYHDNRKKAAQAPAAPPTAPVAASAQRSVAKSVAKRK